MSLPKQLPPQPTPGLRKRAPMRESRPIPVITSVASAPTRSQMFAISLAKPIFIARKAFAAYLIISALVRDVASSVAVVIPAGRGTPGGAIELLLRERGIQLAHDRQRRGVGGAHHDAVGIERVGDRAALAQELGIAGNAESDAAQLRRPRFGDAFAHQCLHEIAAAHRHGRLVDHYAEARIVHGRAYAAGGGFEIAQVGLAAGQRRGSYRYENDVARGNGGGETGGELDTAAGAGQAQHLVEPRLVNGHSPILQLGDLGCVGIDARDMVAQIRQARARNGAHIPGSDDCNLHV